MSHRIAEKEARRQERLRKEADARRGAQRQLMMRRLGYGVVASLAVVLIASAVLLGGNNQSPPSDHVSFMGGSSAGVTVGKRAPDFSLTNVVTGKSLSSASLRGQKTMLFFSEGINCQACMVQAADLQKDQTLRKAGIRLVSVTTDAPGDLAQAARQYGITTPLLSDSSTKMSSAYGMLGHGGMGHPTQDGHAFMLVGPSGKVLWHRAYQEMYVKPSQLMHDMRTEVKA